jgi:photosystem II stability/assembly factor-like uncharacterized protein
MPRPVLNSRTRVWVMSGGASPFTAPSYEGFMKAGTPRYSKGTATPVTAPNPDILDDFIEVEEQRPARTKPQLPLTALYTYQKSLLLELVNQGCKSDIQVHIGICEDPKDFNQGWQKILFLEQAGGDDYGTTGDIGALNEGERAIISDTVTFSGVRLDEILRINLAEQATTEVQTEIVDITICDRVSCSGTCGTGSDGCQRVFAVEKHGGVSPSAKANLIFSDDGGATWDTSSISTMGATDDPTVVRCVGNNLVVASDESAAPSIHYASMDDLFDGTEAWSEVTDGFVATKIPRGIVSLGTSLTWLVGDGGYVYFSDDITSGVDIQDAGNSTSENLKAIAAFDENTLVAVGANNTVLVTTNGGESWGIVTGPSSGNDLLAVEIQPGTGFWTVTDDAGNMYATRNQGRTWQSIGFPGNGSGTIKSVKYSNSMVAWAAQTTGAGAGRLLRSVNGGKTWYVTPEGTGSMPTNTGLNAIAVCSNVNRAIVGGKNSSDGFIVKAA